MDDYNPAQKELVQELSQACDGLMWLSESEYPWQVIVWQNKFHIDTQALLQQYDYESNVAVWETTLESFFQNATTEQEWHDEIEKSETQRYQNLFSWLKSNLMDIRVFLVGEVEIDVYILGKGNSDIIGLSTKIIET